MNMEEWQEAEAATKRVTATLFALAVLANYASIAPQPVRRNVMWILRQAEHAICQFLMHATGNAARSSRNRASKSGSAIHPPSVIEDHSPAAAMRLAARFIWLAQAVENLSPDDLTNAQDLSCLTETVRALRFLPASFCEPQQNLPQSNTRLFSAIPAQHRSGLTPQSRAPPKTH